jgi:hypothetical protein
MWICWINTKLTNAIAGTFTDLEPIGLRLSGTEVDEVGRITWRCQRKIV